MTRKIARELGENDITIISGLAYGIDESAHRGCLDSSGVTCGVMACGMDINYPADSEPMRQ